MKYLYFGILWAQNVQFNLLSAKYEFSLEITFTYYLMLTTRFNLEKTSVFYLLFGYPTVNFVPLSMGQPHSFDVNHGFSSTFSLKVIGSLVTRMAL